MKIDMPFSEEAKPNLNDRLQHCIDNLKYIKNIKLYIKWQYSISICDLEIRNLQLPRFIELMPQIPARWVQRVNAVFVEYILFFFPFVFSFYIEIFSCLVLKILLNINILVYIMFPVNR